MTWISCSRGPWCPQGPHRTGALSESALCYIRNSWLTLKWFCHLKPQPNKWMGKSNNSDYFKLLNPLLKHFCIEWHICLLLMQTNSQTSKLRLIFILSKLRQLTSVRWNRRLLSTETDCFSEILTFFIHHVMKSDDSSCEKQFIVKQRQIMDNCPANLE